MPKWERDLEQLEGFAGEAGEPYRKWKDKVVWILAGTPEDDRHLVAPRLIQKFEGEPERAFRGRDPAPYMTREGVKLLFDELDKYDTYEENQRTINTLSFGYGFKRDPNENATAYCTSLH